MRFLHLTLLYVLLSAFSFDLASEYPPSSPGATNILYQSKDGGQTWEDISYTLPEVEEPEDFSAGKSNLYIRTIGGTYRSNSKLSAPVWEKVDALDAHAGSNLFKPSRVVAAEGVLIATGQRGIRRSTDKGEHWEWVIREGGVGITVERIKGGFAAISYNTTSQSRRIRISLDGGKTWNAIDKGLRPAPSISSIKQIGEYLICGHPDGIYRSSDLGKTWIMVHPSVDANDFRSIPTFNRGPYNDHKKVFKVFVSGNIVYAVAGSAGC